MAAITLGLRHREHDHYPFVVDSGPATIEDAAITLGHHVET
jgi:hypothetical protein